jgi:exopolysaccharide biosynthesis polyprenyl glycosylphosphotransferase
MIRREFLGVGFAVLDFLLSYGVWLGFYFLRRDILYSYQSGLPPSLWEYLWGPLIVGGYWVVLFLLGGLYKDPLRQSFLRRLWQRLWLSILGSLALFFVAFIDDPIPNYKLYYKTLSYYILLQFGVILVGDVLLYAFIRYSLRRKRLRFPTILIGQGEKAYKIWQELTNNPFGTGYDIIGYVTPYSEKPNLLSGKLRHLGRLEELESILHRRSPHQVVIAVEEQEGDVLRQVLGAINGLPIEVYLAPEAKDYIGGTVRLESPQDTPLIRVGISTLSPWEELLKRIFDVVVSLVVLILFSPVYAILSILVRLSSPGPIIFRQERLGKNMVPFTMYKFRTMYVDAEKDGPALSREGDPRITPIGRWLRKTRLDELPQFWNVLIGDMSLVGPRPERKYYADQILLRAPEYRQLFKIKPGITSLGMVKYGYASSVDEMIERMQYDLIYLANRSFLLDLKILLYTVLRVIQARGK